MSDVLNTAAAAVWTARLVPKLGATTRKSFQMLLPLFHDGKASLAAALAIVAPDKQDAAKGTAAFQTYISRINKKAREHQIPITIRVDSEKRLAPAQRVCWLEGQETTLDSLEALTDAAIGIQDRLPAVVQPQAWIRTVGEIAGRTEPKPLIKFFVSYAHADEHVAELLRLLKDHLRISSKYKYEVWTDRNIELGKDWHQAIQRAITECDFGLLLVSTKFLGSEYIRDHELPHFVNGSRPVFPVALSKINFKRDLRGLEQRQIFHLTDENNAHPRPFNQCRGTTKEAFIDALVDKIEDRIVTTSAARETAARDAASSARVSDPAETPDRRSPPPTAIGAPAEPPEHEDDLLGKFSQQLLQRVTLPANLAMPRADTPRLKDWERDGKVDSRNTTNAVDFLVDWACDPNKSPFAAVLGEVGIGKTTTLMMVSRRLEAAHLKDPTVPVPIFVDLRLYAEQTEINLDGLLADVIRHYADGSCAGITPDAIKRAVRDGRAVIIFDGLDEKIIPLPDARRVAFVRELWQVLPPQTLDHSQGKMIISCRSHYFPTVAAQNSGLIGQGRDGVKLDDYTACVILPFNDDQIRDYLGKSLGMQRVEPTMELFRSVHDLTGLSERPYLLSLLVDQIEELERKRACGEMVLGVTLYEGFVEKWLHRDDGKHQFTPEHKLTMMEELAHDLWRANERLWNWKRVGKWLDAFLHRHPEIQSRYAHASPEVLNQDFRTATFFLRPDGEKEGFRFAHTSLQEFFLAARLVRALEENEPDVWDLPLPSDETLDFAGQILHLKSAHEQAAAMKVMAAILESTMMSVAARTAAFRYWLLGYVQQRPTPIPRPANLADLDLSGLEIRGRGPNDRFPLRQACLDRTEWRNTRLYHIDLTEAHATTGRALRAEFHHVQARGFDAGTVDFTSSTWRFSDLSQARLAAGQWYAASFFQTRLDQASLPKNWCDTTIECHPVDRLPGRALPREGHSNWVRSCAYSPDGSRIVSASSDQTLRIWDARSGDALLTLAGHTSAVLSCAYSPDGSRIVSASVDRTLRIWDARSGDALLTLAGHSNGVLSCAYSPDGSRIVSASDDQTLWIWDARSGAALLTLAGHTSAVMSCAYSPDGSRIVSTGRDGTQRIWDAETGTLLLTTILGTSNQYATLDPVENRVLHASEEGWRLFGWRSVDPATGRIRILPAEYYGPLPA